MLVSVVNITEPIGVNKKSNKNAHILATSTAGGVAGLALRQFTPVTKSEIDTVLFEEANTIRQNDIKQARKNIVKEIVKEYNKDNKNPALQLFLDRIQASMDFEKAYENKQWDYKEYGQKVQEIKNKIKDAPENVQNEIKSLTKRVINKVKAARVLTESTIKSSVKQQRPFAAFVLPGLALGALAGFVYNVIDTITDQQ